MLAAAARAATGRRALAARVSDARMARLAAEGGGNVEAAILTDLVAKARQWLYAPDPI